MVRLKQRAIGSFGLLAWDLRIWERREGEWETAGVSAFSMVNEGKRGS